MRPAEVGRSTIAELADMIDGWVWRDELGAERLAWALAHLMNVSGKTVKHRVTARKLLGRGVTPGRAGQDEKDALWAAIQKSKPPEDN